MHSLDIQQRWRTPNLDKWVIGRWMLWFTKSVHLNLHTVANNQGARTNHISPASTDGINKNSTRGMVSPDNQKDYI